MAPRKNHTCKHGRRADGFCKKRGWDMGLSRSEGLKKTWHARRLGGFDKVGPKRNHNCKHGRQSNGYCRKTPLGKNKAAMKLQALFRGKRARAGIAAM